MKIKAQSVELAKRHLISGGFMQTRDQINTWSNHFYLMLTGKLEPDVNLKRLLEE